MTKYTLEITTFKTGMSQKFEFSLASERINFLVMFINGMTEKDYIIKVVHGERTFSL